MKYAGFMPNDFVNGEGVCVSLWTQGCPFHCKGCHNPESWDYNGGYNVPKNLIERLKQAITANGITRNFSILGGEPLCDANIEFTTYVVREIREAFPDIKIFIWTGYDMDDIRKHGVLLSYVDTVITGKFDLNLRDVTLKLRGSRNQEVLHKGIDF